ncbi:MAG TPA: wax ester/triacylglycerol synthase family O-acyltransferase [Nocardioidaceae bacterium]|nr:wax ester/triacylglycerol synthase family O-acyltransferase [Nocardioidaceae bacterium]
METLSALDSAFLVLEDETSFLHIGSVAVFEGPAPTFDAFREAIRRKLPLVPRYRQRLLTVPGQLGRPVWVDDPDFDLDFHVRGTRVRSPGDDQALQDLAGHVMSMPLDRDHPLWEDWYVGGLADGRWAVITKVHHSMVDGIAGTDLLSLVLDKSAEPDDVPLDTFDPEPLPTRTALLVRATRERLADPYVDARLTVSSLRHPQHLFLLGAATARGLAGFAAAARPVSRTSLVGSLGRERLYRWADVSIDDLRLVRAAYGGTLNDVVLAGVTLGFQDLLRGRHEHLTKHAVRTLVPVSVRLPDQRGQWDNRVSAIVAELPVETPGPVDVLREVTRRMDVLKASHEAEAGQVMTTIADLMPPQGLSALLRVAFRFPQCFLSTVTTNVPGPRTELFLAGRRMLASYPYVPIADRLRVGIAVTSYGGRLLFGITADRRSSDDVDTLRNGLVEGFDALVRAAKDDLG